MNHIFFAELSLSMLCVIQALATVAIDFNKTHATNPLWPGHARFHVVWQSSAVFLLSAVELGLIWWNGPSATLRFYLAALLASSSPLGFLAAFAARSLYRGTLSDPNGVPELRMQLFGATRRIDMNLVAVLLALVSVCVIVAIYRS